MNRRDFLHYLSLLLILLLGIGGFLIFRYQPSLRLLAVGLAVAGYILWGVVHHYLEDRLQWDVVGEYILVGILALLLLLLTLR